MGIAVEATAEKIAGGRPSVVRSLIAAVVVAGAAAVLAYRFLRAPE